MALSEKGKDQAALIELCGHATRGAGSLRALHAARVQPAQTLDWTGFRLFYKAAACLRWCFWL